MPTLPPFVTTNFVEVDEPMAKAGPVTPFARDVGDHRLLVYLASTPTSLVVVEGEHPTFFNLHGTADAPVQNIAIKNIRFDKGGFQSKAPYITEQGALYTTNNAATAPRILPTGAVAISNGKNISVTNSVFRDLLGSGISVGSGSSDVTISNNTFSEIGGSAIVLGTYKPHISRITVSRNSIVNVGRIFTNSPAIYALYVGDSEFSFNSIAHATYSGITVQSSANHIPVAGVGNNLVHDNIIAYAMEVHNDGGAIYTMGDQPGTKIYQNTIWTMGVGYNTRGMLPGARGYPIYIDTGGNISVFNNTLKSINWSVLSPDVSAGNPIFGPGVSEPAGSPCGMKACNVTQYNNVSS